MSCWASGTSTVAQYVFYRWMVFGSTSGAIYQLNAESVAEKSRCMLLPSRLLHVKCQSCDPFYWKQTENCHGIVDHCALGMFWLSAIAVSAIDEPRTPKSQVCCAKVTTLTIGCNSVVENSRCCRVASAGRFADRPSATIRRSRTKKSGMVFCVRPSIAL